MRRFRLSTWTLLAVLATTLAAPLAPLARAEETGPSTCRCPVKMACCEAGLCHDAAPGPARSSAWSSCADEAPRDASPAPSTTFDTALVETSALRADVPGARLARVNPRHANALAPAPSFPPPRRSASSR